MREALALLAGRGNVEPVGPNGGYRCAQSTLRLLQPAYLQPGTWEFTGYSETGMGRITTSCNVPDVGRAPD